MFIRTVDRNKIELELIPAELVAETGRLAVRSAKLDDRAGRIARAAQAFLGLDASESLAREPPIGVFREKVSGMIRLVHKQIMLRWVADSTTKVQARLLGKHGLELVSKSAFVRGQIVVRCRKKQRSGADLIELANALADADEVAFATPDFVSEYRRSAATGAIIKDQWHLKNTGAFVGQKAGEDVKAEGAWAKTTGKPAVVVAVLDDGVDVDHPNLKTNIVRLSDPDEPRDKCGRDFFIPNDDSPDHFDPRPKLFQYPYDRMRGNDIHGTPCAGVIAAAGKVGSIRGIAPRCRILPVKIFHADSLASDARVADAIRYAAARAAVLSCSWSGGYSSDIEFALQDAATERGGKGAVVFCAAGNENGSPVGYPARSPRAVAVGASTDQGQLADYSNVGREIWIVAPSSGGVRGICTTDVSYANRGFNLGTDVAGGADGWHTNSFGGTSSATPLVAGVAALLLSLQPSLTGDEIKERLRTSADRIGPDHDATSGHSKRFGYGRVNAAKAVA